MLTAPKKAWAIVDAVDGTLVLFSGSLPIYWHRNVAKRVATEHGFTVDGKEPDVRICAVVVTQYGGTEGMKGAGRGKGRRDTGVQHARL